MYLVETPISLPQTVAQVTALTSALQMGLHNLHTYAGVASQIITTHLLQQVQEPRPNNLRLFDLEVKITSDDTVILVTAGSQAPPRQAPNQTQNLGLVMKLPVPQQRHVRRPRPIPNGQPPLFTFPFPLHHLYLAPIQQHHSKGSKISLFLSDLPTTRYLLIPRASSRHRLCRQEHAMFQHLTHGWEQCVTDQPAKGLSFRDKGV
jgi:hypothetical protein